MKTGDGEVDVVGLAVMLAWDRSNGVVNTHVVRSFR